MAEWSPARKKIVMTLFMLSGAFFIMGIFCLTSPIGSSFILFFFLSFLTLLPASIICYTGRKPYASQMRLYRARQSMVPHQTGPNSFVYPVAYSGSLPRSSTNLAASTSSGSPMVIQPTAPTEAVIRPPRSRGDTPPPSYEECVSGRASPLQPHLRISNEMYSVEGESASHVPGRPPSFNPLFIPERLSPRDGNHRRFLPERLSTGSLSSSSNVPILSSGRISPRIESAGLVSPGRLSPGRSSPRRESPGRISYGRSSPGTLSPYLSSQGGETFYSPNAEVTHYGHL